MATARAFDIITFDCYGTLIDWNSGIRNAFASMATALGSELDVDEALRLYAQFEPLTEQTYRSYADVLAVTATRVVETLGVRNVRRTAARYLETSLPSWMPFADTNSALERLRAAGYRLGILSNVDNSLLARTREHFTVDFDLVVTAEDVRSYKPGPAHFLTANRAIGTARWLHAAQSNFHDIVPANALGIPSAWVNRRAEAPLPGGTPTYEVRDMKGLADLLA